MCCSNESLLNDTQKVAVAKMILSIREKYINPDYVKEGGTERRLVIDEVLMLSAEKILDL